MFISQKLHKYYKFITNKYLEFGILRGLLSEGFLFYLPNEYDKINILRQYKKNIKG